MKNKFSLAHLYRAAILAVAVTITMEAAPTELKLWRELAGYLQGKLLTVQTKDGRSVSGRHFVVRPDGIFFNDGTPTTVSREAVLSLHWEAPHERQIHKLGKILAAGYRHAGKALGTPAGPGALVELPIITVYGVAATPFCLLGDLFAGNQQASGDISILPEQGVSK